MAVRKKKVVAFLGNLMVTPAGPLLHLSVMHTSWKPEAWSCPKLGVSQPEAHFVGFLEHGNRSCSQKYMEKYAMDNIKSDPACF